jgi:methionyl aminopeptidase|tara:strand:- start:43393 stop:43788 length:396 start_codon:yes stop_codon:yes gene_type:complete
MSLQLVSIHTPEEVAMSRRAGHLAADVLRMITEHIKPGITTDAIDQLCNTYIVEELQAIPANVGYNGFPKTVCTSVNHVVCHGIPSAKQLKKGDIVSISAWFANIAATALVRSTTMSRKCCTTAGGAKACD